LQVLQLLNGPVQQLLIWRFQPAEILSVNTCMVLNKCEMHADNGYDNTSLFRTAWQNKLLSS
jgi:hypothetical protein